MEIPGVIHRRAALSHTDDRRNLFSVFNDDLEGFVAVQLKWFEFISTALVGKHYHDAFDEVFCIIKGEGHYELVDVHCPERRETFTMRERDMILVPRGVAHRAIVQKGSIILAANSGAYVSPEVSDFSFDFGHELKIN